MPYLAFDLDALASVPDVASTAGISEGDVAHGLLRMWAHCFKRKTDRIESAHVQGFFGGDSARVAAALAVYDFLEADGGGFRVRGADRYLRISKARSKGGKKSAANLRQFRARAELSTGSAPAQAGEEPETSPAHGDMSTGSAPALTPSTEHRAPNTTLSGKPATGGDVLELRPTEAGRRPRTPSKAEALFIRLEESRESACAEAGAPYIPEGWHPKRINAQLGAVAKAAAAEQAAFEAAWGAYLDDAGNAAKEPPFSIGFFLASRSTWESRAKRSGGAA